MDNRFILEGIYKDVSKILSSDQKKLKDVIDTAHITVDSNVLLRPYKMEPHNFSAMMDVFEKLIHENRFFLTARTLREFAKNRPEQLTAIYQKLLDHMSKYTTPKMPNIPMFENHELYKKINNSSNNIDASRKDLLKQFKLLLNELEDWSIDDQITTRYKSTLSQCPIIDTTDSFDDLSSEWSFRLKNKIPPGYKDTQKDDDGIGDFLIWKSILTNAKSKSINTVFITDDNKPDWWHRSAGKALFPRHELIQEYKNISNGGSFYMINLKLFLDIMDSDIQLQDIDNDNSLFFDDLDFQSAFVDVDFGNGRINGLAMYKSKTENHVIVQGFNKREFELMHQSISGRAAHQNECDIHITTSFPKSSRKDLILHVQYVTSEPNGQYQDGIFQVDSVTRGAT